VLVCLGRSTWLVEFGNTEVTEILGLPSVSATKLVQQAMSTATQKDQAGTVFHAWLEEIRLAVKSREPDSQGAMAWAVALPVVAQVGPCLTGL